MDALDVLFEDNHLLVVNKPAGCPTMGVSADSDSMVRRAAAYIKQKYSKPGNVYVGVVSRIDSLVSGVLVFARTSKAAARLSAQIREHETGKRYVAWVSFDQPATTPPIIPSEWCTLRDFVMKDERAQKMVVASSKNKEAQSAELRYRWLHCQRDRGLIEVELITGRKHQIRLQLSTHVGSVLGDKKYGSSRSFPHGIALHCLQVDIDHPTRGERLSFVAPPPSSWPRATFESLAALDD